MKIFPIHKKKSILIAIRSFFWFTIGASLGLFLLVSFTFIYFQSSYKNLIYPGVMVNSVNFGGKTENEVKRFFSKENEEIEGTKFIFKEKNDSITISAKEISFGYNEELLAKQAYTVGRSRDIISNVSLVFQAYLYGINLSPSYHYSENNLTNLLSPITQKLNIEPVNALFSFQNGKVSAFRPSTDGQEADLRKIKKEIESKYYFVVSQNKPSTIIIPIRIKIIKPAITTDKANNLGIKELIGTGTSLFQGSISSRIFNITLAATRINGILIAPGEVFSFNKALGDVSAFTGYKQAYVIQNGRTVLGDGGGVCQVSTTFFRALLNAGLPITERNAHAYRVGYYEQDSPPGLDATIYVPNVDLKFKNDSKNYILIQSYIEPDIQRLTFMLYGTKDGRTVNISKPLITGQTPAPAPLYQGDPTLPKGIIKQVDFAASGANVSFTRKVTKRGRIILSDTFISNYRPWQAIYLKGTKE